MSEEPTPAVTKAMMMFHEALARNREITRLEESMRRWEECDVEEVDEDEYGATLTRLVRLHAERESAS